MSYSTDTFLEHPNKFIRRSFSTSIRHHSLPSACIHHSTPYPFISTDVSTNINYSDGSHLHHRVHHPIANIVKEGNTCNTYTSSIANHVISNIDNNQCVTNSGVPFPNNGSAVTQSITCSGVCSFHPPLNPRLWSTLPQEIVEHILAFLPIASIFRFSRVCKSWRDLFFSRGFVSLRAGITNNGLNHLQHRAYFLALNKSRYQQLTAYEVISKRWCCFPLSFLPMVAYPVSAAGGLICFLSSNLDTGYTTFIVCNPVTRRWKELPSMIHKTVPSYISMVVDRKSMTYKILVTGGIDNSKTAQIYDSAIGNWIKCASIPQDEEISRSIVEYGGYYLCLTRGPRSGLLAFNLQKQAWAKMRTSKIPGYSKFRHLVECGGSILVIGKALRRYVLGLYIWCLDPTTLRWREVGKMPRAMCEQFFSSPSECFYCTAQGHLIFFCRYYYSQGLVYNMVDNSWQQVSGCPLLTHPLLLPFDPGLDPVD